MQTKTKNTLIIAIGAFILMGLAGVAGAYFTGQQSADQTASNLPQSMQKTAATSGNSMPWKNSGTAQKASADNNMPWKNSNTQQRAAAQPQQQAAPCNDNNIVGMGVGAILGGVVGNQIGKGSGKTAATIGGTVAGGYLGQQMIPTGGVACK